MKKCALLSILSFLFFASVAQAKVVTESFSEARFIELQQSGSTILVDVYATWCPTCAKQKMILEAYAAERPNADLTILKIDYDDQKEWSDKFKAPRQSTLFLFKGETRLWYSVAEQDKGVIFSELDKGLATPNK